MSLQIPAPNIVPKIWGPLGDRDRGCTQSFLLTSMCNYTLLGCLICLIPPSKGTSLSSIPPSLAPGGLSPHSCDWLILCNHPQQSSCYQLLSSWPSLSSIDHNILFSGQHDRLLWLQLLGRPTLSRSLELDLSQGGELVFVIVIVFAFVFALKLDFSKGLVWLISPLTVNKIFFLVVTNILNILN